MKGGAKGYREYRFTIGTKVLCRTGADEWSAGTIIDLNYREYDWPPGKVVPYQVQLDEGSLIFVPADVDTLCKKLEAPWWQACFRKSASLYEQYNPSAEALAEQGVGKDVNKQDHRGTTALMAAVRFKWLNAVSQLIKMNADLNLVGYKEQRAIHMAAELESDHQNEIIKLLVEAKADLNDQDEDADYDPEFTSTTFGDRLEHRTPLHYLCNNGNAEAAELLLAAKAEVNIQDAQWKTPLHLALEEDNVDCIDLLLKHGADTNLGNQSSGMDNSPLMDAASAGKTEIVKKLIAAKAEINKQGKQQMAALHLAARSRRSAVVEVLLAANADMNQASAVGTPLDLARKNGKEADLLKAFGVETDGAAASSAAGDISSLDAAQRAALFLE